MSAQIRMLYAGRASGRDVLVWTLPEGKLTLTSNLLNGSLILADERMEADIKVYCKAVNSKDCITCW